MPTLRDATAEIDASTTVFRSTSCASKRPPTRLHPSTTRRVRAYLRPPRLRPDDRVDFRMLRTKKASSQTPESTCPLPSLDSKLDCVPQSIFFWPAGAGRGCRPVESVDIFHEIPRSVPACHSRAGSSTYIQPQLDEYQISHYISWKHRDAGTRKGN